MFLEGRSFSEDGGWENQGSYWHSKIKELNRSQGNWTASTPPLFATDAIHHNIQFLPFYPGLFVCSIRSDPRVRKIQNTNHQSPKNLFRSYKRDCEPSRECVLIWLIDTSVMRISHRPAGWDPYQCRWWDDTSNRDGCVCVVSLHDFWCFFVRN